MPPGELHGSTAPTTGSKSKSDRSDANGYVHLVSDTTPNYTDTTPHPATPTVWKYRGIYRVDDSRVGLWSAEVSVMVGG